MYLNVITMKSGATVRFRSEIPYSVDKLESEWNIVKDDINGQVLTLRGSEVASILSTNEETRQRNIYIEK